MTWTTIYRNDIQEAFHDYAQNMLIIDFIAIWTQKNLKQELRKITKIWLNEGTYGDHYKCSRANGVPEKLITGDGDDYDKFMAWVERLKSPWGTHYTSGPIWIERFFHIDEVFSRKTAPEIWKKANALLQTEDFKPRNLIKNSNVKAVCTTDDPASDLHYHKEIKKDEAENGFRTLPAMRPDKLIQIDRDGFAAYLKELGDISGVQISSFKDIIKALHQRFTFFNEMGGRLSDHSLLTYHFVEATDSELMPSLTRG